MLVYGRDPPASRWVLSPPPHPALTLSICTEAGFLRPPHLQWPSATLSHVHAHKTNPKPELEGRDRGRGRRERES